MESPILVSILVFCVASPGKLSPPVASDSPRVHPRDGKAVTQAAAKVKASLRVMYAQHGRVVVGCVVSLLLANEQSVPCT